MWAWQFWRVFFVKVTALKPVLENPVKFEYLQKKNWKALEIELSIH